jgi:two-component system response regulator HydG/two-component system response regulator AtoC
MIYIVDDDKCVLRGFQILLRSEGLESTAFECAEEFIKLWDHNENDLLILDMHMPGISGCYLLEYLEKKNLHLPVIIVTAYDVQASRDCSKRYGTLAYLLKPVDSDVLLNLIKQVSIS